MTYDDTHPISLKIYDPVWDAMRDHEARLVAKWGKRRDKFHVIPRTVEHREDGIALYMHRREARLVTAFCRHAAAWVDTNGVDEGMDAADAKRIVASLRRVAGTIADQGCGAKEADIGRLFAMAKKQNHPDHIGCIGSLLIVATATALAVMLINSLI